MERRETSRLQTPYFSHPSYLTRVGQPVSWLMTGLGRTYLAFCPDRERDATIQLLRKSDQFEDQLADDQKRVDRILAETRADATARGILVSSAASTVLPRTMDLQASPSRSLTALVCTARSHPLDQDCAYG
jgi:hypothetical protein